MRAVKVILISALLLAFLPSFAHARTDGGYMDERIEASGARELFDSLDDRTENLLDELEIKDIDFSSVFNTSPRRIISLIIEIFKGGLAAPVKSLAALSGIIILISCAEGFMSGIDKSKASLNAVTGVFLVSAVAAPISKIIAAASSAVALSGKFMLALIPVLAAVIASSGNILLAACYNSAAFAAAQGVAQLAASVITPCCGLIAGIGVVDAVVPELHLTSAAEFIKKAASWVFGFAAALFTGILSFKGVLASSADTLAAKGIKLAIGSAIPVVGSQLSEAYSSVVGSLMIVRTTIGTFAVIAVALINLPVVAELVLWIAALSAAAVIADILEVRTASGLLKTTAMSLSLLNVCVIFNAVLVIMSTALMLLIKADL